VELVAVVQVAAAVVAVVDSDQVDADEMVAAADSDRHDSYGGEMATVCSDDGDGVAAVLFDSSNNIESNCMDSHICNTPHHDQVLYPEARYMNSMLSTPIKRSKSFSYLLLLIIYCVDLPESLYYKDNKTGSNL
jgi:hypothetical protein